MVTITKREIFEVNVNGQAMDLSVADIYTLRDSLNGLLVKTDSSNFHQEWMALTLQGRKLEAIKALRSRVNDPVRGLKEAKDIVEEFAERSDGYEAECRNAVNLKRLDSEGDVPF